jgi:tryptophan synthase alpha chain
MKIKVCGLTSAEEIRAMDDLGVHHGGLWCRVPQGRYNLSEEAFRRLANIQTERLALVWVTFESTFVSIQSMLHGTSIQAVQLHGFQLPSLIAEIRKKLNGTVKIFKVLHVRDGRCLEEGLIQRYLEAGADYFVIDTFLSKDKLGSTGIPIDIGFLNDFIPSMIDRHRAIIAGGIGAHNIRQVYDWVAPYGVDMDSAVHTSGRIDKHKVRAVICRLPVGTGISTRATSIETPLTDSHRESWLKTERHAMTLTRLEKLLTVNRSRKKKGLIVFINSGDPDLNATRRIIGILEKNNVDAVELCVPFPNSFTDGQVILRSHQRALRNNVSLDDVLAMVAETRRTCKIPIVLLADYSHSVKPIGMEAFLTACRKVHIDGTLIHCLPPLLAGAYHQQSKMMGLAAVSSLYPNSSEATRRKVYASASGFIYLVTTYGRTGGNQWQSSAVVAYLKRVRAETTLPLAVGFGIRTRQDLDALYQAGMDAGIIGSAITAIIEQHLESRSEIFHRINLFLQSISADP